MTAYSKIEKDDALKTHCTIRAYFCNFKILQDIHKKDNYMSKYIEYLKQNIDREANGLHPLPIDGADLVDEII